MLRIKRSDTNRSINMKKTKQKQKTTVTVQKIEMIGPRPAAEKIPAKLRLVHDGGSLQYIQIYLYEYIQAYINIYI